MYNTTDLDIRTNIQIKHKRFQHGFAEDSEFIKDVNK